MLSMGDELASATRTPRRGSSRIVYTAPGIDKARALEGALPKLGIDASEVVSFGDGQNDKSMIEWAGTGVAMGNAVDEVKAVAQMVTANNNEDGIAVALDKLLG